MLGVYAKNPQCPACRAKVTGKHQNRAHLLDCPGRKQPKALNPNWRSEALAGVVQTTENATPAAEALPRDEAHAAATLPVASPVPSQGVASEEDDDDNDDGAIPPPPELIWDGAYIHHNSGSDEMDGA